MKKFYLLIILITISSIGYGQRYFNNNAGNNLWMDAGNWSQGNIGNGVGHKVVIKAGNPIIDGENITVAQIKIGTASTLEDTTVISAINGGTLKITGEGVTAAILNQSTSAAGGKDIKFDLPTTIHAFQAFKTVQILTANGSASGEAKVIFGSNGSLTLANDTDLKIVNVTGSKRVVFDNELTGSNKLIIGATGQIIFGSSFNGTNHTGIVEVLGNGAKLTADVADDGTFITSGNKIVTEAASTGVEVTVNGANTFKGDIETKDGALTYNINKNQSSMGNITLGTGNLNLVIDDAVTSVAFADNSSSTWGDGKVVVTGFKDNVISFGTDANGLTDAQLAKIDAGSTLYIHSNGELSSSEEVIVKSDLMILGVSDPDGGTEGDITTNYEARAIELYAVNDIPDLSKYGIGAANNGGGTDGVEYTLPAVAVSKGTFILLGRDSTNFRNYYGIDYDYNGGGSALGFNGDDAIELFYSGIAIDVFGDINVDGSGQAWDYADGWAYRKNDASPTTTFDPNGWNYSGKDANDDFATNAASSNPYPIKSYKNYKQDLMILGIVDPDGGDEPGGTGSTNYAARAVELYVINDIPDLSKYGVGVANNGGGTDGIEYTFPAEAATAGSFILIGRDSAQARTYFGKDIDYNAGSNALGYNGDDAFELFYNDVLIDVYGDQNVDGSGQDWEYTDGWVHRKNGKTLSATFNANDWDLSGVNVTDDFYTNALNTTNPYPLATYSAEASPTSVYLDSSEGTVNEDGGSFSIIVSISDPSSENATVVDLVFTGSDSTDIGNFKSETVTFPAGSSESQTVNIPITDDSDAEGEEILTFELQNLSGGYQSSLGSPSTFNLTILDNDLGDFSFVYNELHIDPASDITGDANGDGVRDAIADEFIEFINTGSVDFDLSGYYLTDDTEPNLAARHIFPENTWVRAGQAIVVFGGGVPTSPTNFGGAVIQTASENNGGVALGNSGKTLYLKNPDGLTVLSQTYTGAQGSINQSITRNPDLTGDFVSHSGVAEANGALFSPGTRLNGGDFYTHTETTVQFQVAKSSVKEGEDSNIILGVTINGANQSNPTIVSVGYESGTATADDFDGFTETTVTFPAGSSETQYITLNITDDDLQEGNENFVLTFIETSSEHYTYLGYPLSHEIILSDDDISNPLILNEVLTDPPSDDAATTDVVEGDANGDGTRSPSDDEFVELVNTNTSQIDISGYTISDGAGLRHTFPENTLLDGGKAIVVFGGGSPTGDFGGATVQTATGGSLSLNNTGDKVVVNDNDGNTIIEFEWGGSTIYDGGADQSLTRDPDLTGDFILHTTTVAGGTYSPGTQSDGSAFDVGLNEPTSVQFSSNEFTLANSDGSYDTGDYEIVVEISNPSASVATQVEVVFTASDLGSAADLSDYSGEVLTFSSGSTSPQTSVVTISSSDIVLGTKYDFALQNVSGGNLASLGENTTFTLTIGDPGSVPLNVENDRVDINVSPNPTSDVLKVSINNNKVLKAFVINDMNGRSLVTKSVGRVINYFEVDVKSFNNGLYILNLEFEDESAKLKFIKE